MQFHRPRDCLGQVYVFSPNRRGSGALALSVEPLHRVIGRPGERGLSGQFARVVNGAAYHERLRSGDVVERRIGDVLPNDCDRYLFRPRSGGGRLDKLALPDPAFIERYSDASHFGEVNTYYHTDRIAAYVDGLLRELGRRSLPRVRVVIHAHHAGTERDGVRDGVRGRRQWLPFQGGHYRLPGGTLQIVEREPLSPDGEIHLGPGWRLLRKGALVDLWGHPYRANASHNPGIIYHEYGHHVTRHTADFQGNRGRPANQQRNKKTAIDEGTCDYLAAVSLGTPHIWICHHQHDAEWVHPRSLVSRATMANFDVRPEADAHANGTIWAAGLYSARRELDSVDGRGRQVDLLLLETLCRLGEGTLGRRAKASYPVVLSHLLEVDRALFHGLCTPTILRHLASRGIVPECAPNRVSAWSMPSH